MVKPQSLMRPQLGSLLRACFLKLSPGLQVKSPVMFTVYVGAILTTYLIAQDALFGAKTLSLEHGLICVWLWITVLFANFAESMAEGRGKAQASALRQSRTEIIAKKIATASRSSPLSLVSASALKKGDFILVEAGDYLPSDGQVIEGIASVNESAITGESAPVIRESGGDRSSVTGGTQLLSDWLIVQISSNPGETFLDKMIALVEGAKRKKTPNELALTILLAGLSLVFLFVCGSLLCFSIFEVKGSSLAVVSIPKLIALFVCLAPTTIGGLLSAIGIAGMDRMIQANVIAMSGRAIEAAGDVDVLILDKTGTITLGDRQAVALIPAPGQSMEALAQALLWATYADETPEGRSIIQLIHKNHPNLGKAEDRTLADFIPFSAETCMSGADIAGRQIRKGSADAVQARLKSLGGLYPQAIQQRVQEISKQGGTALVVMEAQQVLGVVQLKDIVKSGIKERFAQLRRMGIKTIMVTGDNSLTAAAIAAEAGVDDFLANAKPADKLQLIRDMQAKAMIVAMTGDGTNDAPALAQADVALAMNSGTQAAKEAGNLIDLDSDPSKLIEVVAIGKQLLMTRGALTSFSLANDLAKYFAIIPAAFAASFPALNQLNLMHLSPDTAIVSAVIFNALIMLALIPLALKGIGYRYLNANDLLKRHLLIYGLGGLVLPFIGIKLLDILMSWLMGV